jgi:hypothetical protein
VLNSGVAVVGMATALAVMPDLPARWQAGADLGAPIQPIEWRDRALAGLARMALVKRRLRMLGAGRTAPARYSAVLTLILDQLRTRRLTRRYRQWKQEQA